MFLLNSVDFQQLKQLMFLAEYWVYKLKQVDISRVSIADRNRALGYLEAGWTVPRVARHVGVHQQTNAVADRPRSGRPRVTSDRQDRHIVTSYFYQHHPQLSRPLEHIADQSAMIQFVTVCITDVLMLIRFQEDVIV